MNRDFQDLIRRSGLFKNVSEAVFEQVLATGLLRSVEEDGFYFIQGDPATHAYVLVKGQVKMVQITPGGLQIILRIMTPGQTFGGIAMLNPAAGYPATAQATKDSIAVGWSTDNLRSLAALDPNISLNTMQLMHIYITDLQERQQGLVASRVEQRIARVLLKLAYQTGKKVDEGVLISIPLTRQDIAEMAGTTLSTVSRTMKEWERVGFLSIGREKVVIREPHSLVRLADDLVDSG
jgi:CRP/FNR family transcriptional regulator, nitrogen oxide reductase regulator